MTEVLMFIKRELIFDELDFIILGDYFELDGTAFVSYS